MDNNIHEVEFGNSTLTQIEQLYQYDKGQILKITDKVEDGTEVQFSNNNSELTINKAINDSQVEIPDILLQENKKILAYLKIINSDSETTIKTVIIPVKARTKPADYIEPEQEKPFRKYVEEKLENAEKLVAEANDKVKVNEECLKQIDIKTEQSVNQIAEVTNGKIKDLDNTTNAKLTDINNTAVSQIDAINRVANQNTKSGTEAVATAAQAQIGGINTVADAQKKGITETAQGKIKDINNTAVSQIEAINNIATSQIKSINNVAQENINMINGVSDGNTKEIATALDMIVDTFEKKIAIEKPYYAYLMDSKIGDFNDDEITKVRKYAFYEKKSLTSINLPACTSIDASAFDDCTALTSISLPACTSIDSSAFYGCSALTIIKLTNPSKICTLSNSNAFKNTAIANKVGYIYVPDELIEQYKTATNWSVYASQIKPLSAYTEE
nr:MAG TPA: leucine-rich repeat protein [Caudoviricetes sp.]